MALIDLFSYTSQISRNKIRLQKLFNIGARFSSMMARGLAAFDFDHTIIHDNSDTAVITLLDKSKIPKEIRALHRNDGWTAFMQGIFKLLHENRKDEADITKLIENLQPVEGMCNLLKELYNMNYDIIIISDSNSYFIDVWLKKFDLSDKVCRVFTNPAQFVNGLLNISMFHLQSHCKLSTKNLCKGQILEDFIVAQKKLGVNYNRLVYVGDGNNDFCPILKLNDHDLAYVRAEYKCVEYIRKAKQGIVLNENDKPYDVRPQVIIWRDGHEILESILQSPPVQLKNK